MSKVIGTEVVEVAERLEGATAQEVLEWAKNKFGSNVALASSFGAEDVVLIDMMSKIFPKPRIFTLDTGRLHQETYDLMDKIRNKYGVDIEVYFPETSAVQKMVREHGLNLFYESTDLRVLCCTVRKVEPLNRALANLGAWITGLRREQATTRTETKKVEFDKSHGNIKINPLADWTNDQVWTYIKKNKVPYNALHDQDFPSIGCLPCTRAVKPGEDPRSGRWWWEQGSHKECGLHLKNKETTN